MKENDEKNNCVAEENLGPAPTNKEQPTEERKAEAKSALKRLLSNDEEEKVALSFYTILGGELLAYLLRKQIRFVAFLTLLVLIYVTNRYSYQDILVDNKELREQLEDRRLRAVVASSNLIEYTRRSNVQEEMPDTTLHQADIPHRYIKLKTSAQ